MPDSTNCPCKRIKCVRHGNCDACRNHHCSQMKTPTACDRLKLSAKKSFVIAAQIEK